MAGNNISEQMSDVSGQDGRTDQGGGNMKDREVGEVEMTDLRPCPFCEESAQIEQLPFCPEDIKSKKWVVGCDGKNGSLCPGYIWKCAPFYVTRDQAVDYWNHRAPNAKGR